MPKQYTFEELKDIVRNSTDRELRAIALDYAYSMGRWDRLDVTAKELPGFFSPTLNERNGPYRP